MEDKRETPKPGGGEQPRKSGNRRRRRGGKGSGAPGAEAGARQPGGAGPGREGGPRREAGGPGAREGGPRREGGGRHDGSKRHDKDKQRQGSSAPAQGSRDLRQGREKPKGKGGKGERQEKPEPAFVHVARRYGVLFYDTMAAAKADLATIAEQTKQFDQLNVVIRAEANMDDPELNAIPQVKVFAGTAWALIHDRRQADGWYDAPR